jgi:hypothetical protein
LHGTHLSNVNNNKKKQTITKDPDKPGRIIIAAFHENAVNNDSKSDLLRHMK